MSGFEDGEIKVHTKKGLVVVRQCSRCSYTWVPKVSNPKECPRCKARQDKRVG